MPQPEAERLRAIKTFPQLVKYLRDDLDWPIDSESFDDLTYDYDPDELGLDRGVAAKVRAIKQLRPLTTGQPWGIFFLDFEPKKLPIVALRRILRSLVAKKRHTANKSDRAVWNLHDLLFISSYGEKDHRDLTFAHFTDSGEAGDLPVLRVLGWDDEDTASHLAHAHETLKQKLHWPADADSVEEWRAQWAGAFQARHGEVIATSKALAMRLADLARAIRKRANAVLALESDAGPLRKLHAAFRESLIHDLSEDDFADAYAQTIAYGLLSAKVCRPAGLVTDDVVQMVPVTNPFLKELLESFLKAGGRRSQFDFDELGVTEVTDTLRDADMAAVLRDFGDKNPREDPVIHFYELFLKEYDAKKRMQRGVFYTPRPVVSYIVRSVHELLQKEFGLPDGLADTATWGDMQARLPDLKLPAGVKAGDRFVTILDPATGTGTFLVEVIEVIHNQLMDKWRKAGHGKDKIAKLWNEYVPEHLLPRLHGYELLMAPYAIAHMKIGLKLAETGYKFASDERARVYLTNALEPAQTIKPDLFENDALAHEAAAVNEVKRDTRFTVVVGNPPYSQYSANLTETAKRHIEPFRVANGTRIQARNALQLERNLNDDYVKFLGLATASINATLGIIGMITNRMFLDSESLVGVRERIASDFSSIKVLDLHGDAQAAARIAALRGDENVFEIAQGVAITMMARLLPKLRGVSNSNVGEINGSCESKMDALSRGTYEELCSECVIPVAENWWLTKKPAISEGLTSLEEIMPKYSTLVATNRDHLVVDFEDKPIIDRVNEFRHYQGSDSSLCSKFEITMKSNWNIAAARRRLAEIKSVGSFIRRIEYRPFDYRRVFFHKDLVWQTAPVVSENVLADSDNVVLVSLGRNRANTINGQWVTRCLADKSIVSSRDNASGFPLYLYEADTFSGRVAKDVNLSAKFVADVATMLKGQWDGKKWQGDGVTVTPMNVIGVIYSLFYSHGYRLQFAASLAHGFPPILMPRRSELFHELAVVGGELVALHLMESRRLDRPMTKYIGPAKPEVEKVTWAKDTVWLDKASSVGFRGVPEDVWNFHVGGYQVCHKWLKDRKGRVLSAEDIAHYQKIVVALHETIRLMKEVDAVIEKHGGWPGAFAAPVEPPA